MKKRYAYFSSFVAAGDLTPTEDEASSWLLDSPRLLDWPRKIHWLWSQRDPRKTVACLWGIDTAGTLIIVEIRKDRGDEPDPYEKLVLETKNRASDRDWAAETLRQQWRKTRAGKPCEDTDQESVERLLKRRGDVGNPHPVLVGVVASARQEFRLSSKARKNFVRLQKRVGDERVRLSVISGTFGSRGLRVQCKTLDEPDQVQPRELAANELPDRKKNRRSPCSKRSRVWRYVHHSVAQG